MKPMEQHRYFLFGPCRDLEDLAYDERRQGGALRSWCIALTAVLKATYHLEA